MNGSAARSFSVEVLTLFSWSLDEEDRDGIQASPIHDHAVLDHAAHPYLHGGGHGGAHPGRRVDRVGPGPRDGHRPAVTALQLLEPLGLGLPEPDDGHLGPDVLAGLAGGPE